MIHLHLTPLPTVPLYPVTAVVPHGSWTVYAGEEALPTWLEECIKVGNRSTQVSCFVTPEQHGKGLTVRVGNTAPLGADLLVDLGAVYHLDYLIAEACMDLRYEAFHRSIGFGAFELTVLLSNGDTSSPSGHRTIDLRSVTPPPGWVFVPLDARKIDSPFTLHQGALWTWRVIVCPKEWEASAKVWAVEAGRAFATDEHGRIVTPRANGMAWPLLSKQVQEYCWERGRKWLSQHELGLPKSTGNWPYGEDVLGSEGEQDPEGQPYGGMTGGQDFEWFVEEMAARAAARLKDAFAYQRPFALLVNLDQAIRDRCLHMTCDAGPVLGERAGFKLNISAANGAKLYATKSGDVYGFASASDAPGTVNRLHGSVDWQHGSMRHGAAEMLATLWNDAPAKHLLAIEAAMARAEMPNPSEKGGAIGRAEFWAGVANGNDVAFSGDADDLEVVTAAEEWLRTQFLPAVTAIQRPNGGVCAWLNNKEATEYALDYLESVGLPRTLQLVSRPEQEIKLLSALWRMIVLGMDEAIEPAAKLAYWIGYMCREPGHASSCVRVGMDGSRLDAKDDSWYYRHLLAIVATAAKRWALARPLAVDLLVAHTGTTGPQACIAYFSDKNHFENAAGLVAALQT